ncbi:hypothetical protein ccbrp13_07230 [Ktedonobacteria bacterium brp13]|nr:hypothetical protein ccbrp13_07230 [Ktedonobacteria bacterium brp13]
MRNNTHLHFVQNLAAAAGFLGLESSGEYCVDATGNKVERGCCTLLIGMPETVSYLLGIAVSGHCRWAPP